MELYEKFWLNAEDYLADYRAMKNSEKRVLKGNVYDKLPRNLANKIWEYLNED